MVSLRRKKYKKSFVGEKRRSARLLALEVVGSGKSSNQMQWKGNHEDTHHTQEIGETSNGICSSNSTASKIIQHVLDVLELKDTHELFTMPDSMQIDDYTERVENPSDFATLRQKHSDGMYTTLEQFESDVYTVFKKAITINDHNTIPYKQAIFLQDQAKQVLQSLKNNCTNSKLEVSAWQQKHIRGRKKLRQNDETAPASSTNQAVPSGKRNNHICSKRKLGNLKVSVTENENDACLNGTNRYLRNVLSKSNQNFQTREEPHMREPRLTYMDNNGSDFGIVSSTFGNQNPYLALNALTTKYEESLCIFTKDAGMKAQKAAEKRCQVCTKMSQDPYFTRRLAQYFPQISTSSSGPSFDSTRLAQYFPQQMTLYNSTNCKLETDDLLRWFQSIGTPEFIEKGNAAGPTMNENILSENKDKKPITQQPITDFPKKGPQTVKQTTRLKDNGNDLKHSTASNSFNGIVSCQLGFSQYATLFKPFKPDV